MKTNSKKIIFMGTPEFAVPSLKAIHAAGYTVPLVVTMPDRPKGRGRQLTASPVKYTAEDLCCTCIQPDTICCENVVDQLQDILPDFIVVVAFGYILPESILKLPRYGAINVHASLLPKYRGPAPIQWAIINGEKETGVTTMLMDKGLDTGDILLTATTEILAEDNSKTLRDRLSNLGASLLIDTLNAFIDNRINPIKQDHSQSNYAPLLKKSDGKINWSQDATQIDAFIRGMTPWPGAFTFYNGKRYKIIQAKPIDMQYDQHLFQPGQRVNISDTELTVATTQGAISILSIQPESGKLLKISDFLRGSRLPEDAKFGSGSFV
ncbi:MAG: methionyl-tRNA formyltransferase [Desulfobacterales bacterium]|nr:methionyl-tRNA formyltransferase [Desulfobacterales bacterium]